MSQLRLARLCVMLAAVGLTAAPALMNNAFAQKKEAPAAAPAAPKADTVRPEMFKLLDPTAIQPLLQAKNFTEVQSRITQADALADKTPYEVYVIDRMKLSLALKSGNDAAAIAPLEALLASGKVTPAERGDYLETLANMYISSKNYPKAIDVLKRYQQEGATPQKVRPMLAKLYYANGEDAKARTELQAMIAETEAAGKTPSQEDLRMLASTGTKLKDDATYMAALEKMAVYYPTDDVWLSLIGRGVQQKPGFNAQENAIDLYRLVFAAAKKLDTEQYVNLAELALQAGFPTEAKKVVDAGFAAGALGTGNNAAKHRQLRDRAAKAAADDARTIAAGEASSAKSKNGAGLVNIGWAYVTMDQFDKGIGFIQQGIAKGGLKQPDEAKLRLGMAYARAGRKDEAIKTFQGVKAGGGLSDLAKYWILLEKQPAQAAAAAAAAAAAPAK